MKVLILAAGRGYRLGELTSDRPKSLLDLNGETILGIQLRILKECGIKPEDIFIIVGYKKEKIKELVPEKINIIENPLFASTNNVYTLYLALKTIKDGFILLNGDVVFPKNFLERLINTTENCLVVDSVKRLGEEEMKIRTENNRITEVKKTIQAEESDGEYIGMARFSDEGNRTLFNELSKLIDEGKTQEWYEAAFNNMCKNTKIAPLKVKEKWVEIDTKEDLDYAKRIFGRG